MISSLIYMAIILIFVCLIMYGIEELFPFKPAIKRLVQIVVILIVLLLALQYFPR